MEEDWVEFKKLKKITSWQRAVWETIALVHQKQFERDCKPLLFKRNKNRTKLRFSTNFTHFKEKENTNVIVPSLQYKQHAKRNWRNFKKLEGKRQKLVKSELGDKFTLLYVPGSSSSPHSNPLEDEEQSEDLSVDISTSTPKKIKNEVRDEDEGNTSSSPLLQPPPPTPPTPTPSSPPLNNTSPFSLQSLPSLPLPKTQPPTPKPLPVPTTKEKIASIDNLITDLNNEIDGTIDVELPQLLYSFCNQNSLPFTVPPSPSDTTFESIDTQINYQSLVPTPSGVMQCSETFKLDTKDLIKTYFLSSPSSPLTTRFEETSDESELSIKKEEDLKKKLLSFYNAEIWIGEDELEYSLRLEYEVICSELNANLHPSLIALASQNKIRLKKNSSGSYEIAIAFLSASTVENYKLINKEKRGGVVDPLDSDYESSDEENLTKKYQSTNIDDLIDEEIVSDSDE